MVFELLCHNELRHDVFHFVELLLSRTEFFHEPFVVLGATCALLVALALMFFDNVLLLIIGQGPPVLVEPREYFPICCMDAGFWGPFPVELLYLLWVPVSADPPRMQAAATRRVV